VIAPTWHRANIAHQECEWKDGDRGGLVVWEQTERRRKKKCALTSAGLLMEGPRKNQFCLAWCHRRIHHVLRVLTVARRLGVICGVLLGSICLLSAASRQTVGGLVELFESTTVFWEQFEVAKKIGALHDKSVLPRLETWLRCEDMRRRGNAAF